MAAPTFPRMFGKYALLRPFARGGMGEICLAAHGDLGGLEKLCLVKRVLEADDQPSLQARLLDEAKVAVRLNHANLVQVFDAGKVDEELYIAMELIEGRDLRAVWNRTAERRSRIPLDVALYVVREMARGLEYAHNYGGLKLVHRDIAPPNILLSWHGEVKITDFGLARSTLKSEKTAPGIVYGRIAYLAPEQARGEQADNRTDLYAVGVILWELLTGRPLHETTDEAVKNLEMARHPSIEAPSHFARGVAPSLDAVVLKALAPKREDRYQTSEELRRGLSEELARVAPTTDASRLATWLSELFESEVKSEAIDNERLLREELPRLRARHTFQVAAPPTAKPQVVRAQSLDLHIAGVDRDSDRLGAATVPPPAAPAPRPLPGMGPSAASTGLAGKPLDVTPTSPPRSTRGPAAGHSGGTPFDDDGETRVKAPLRPSQTTRAGQTARPPKPARELDDTLAAEDLIGDIIDARYRIERLLGTGGMGAVYEAEHIDIGKKVALKVLHPQFSRQADLVARFRREARAASKVGHPNIVDVTDSGTTESGDAYFVMEHLDGTDLGDVLRHERRIAVDRTLAIGTQICRALQAAHAAGIIHRDLKPENIFLVAREGQPDFVKVLDFGIAKSESTALQPRRLTTPGIAMGTPEYMAPEQAAGKPVDGRVDIYSVGAILYEMLSGQPPHAGSSVMDILAKKATEAPEPLRARNKSVPEPLEAVIMCCLEREPSARPQTMAALEYELTKYGKGRGSAVAAVLGIKSATDGGWGDDPSRTNNFEGTFGGAFGGATILSAPRSAPGADFTSGEHAGPDDANALAAEEEIVDLDDVTDMPAAEARAGVLDTLPASTPGLVEPKPELGRLSPWSRVLGIVGGVAFLGVGGYFAYAYQQGLTNVPRVTQPGSSPDPGVAATDPGTPHGTELPDDPTAPTPGTPAPTHPRVADATAGDEHLSDAEILRLLEWARRTAEGGRIVAPPGDNLKELLDRVEKANPGNAGAADLRKRTSMLLSRRGALALKKLRLEEAEDAYRALVVLNPEDDASRGRLARTLAVRADRSLERRRYQAAANDANQALELQPDDVLARMVLAEAHLATGKRELAAEEFKRVLELRPADKRAKRGLTAAVTPSPKRGKPAPKKKR